MIWGTIIDYNNLHSFLHGLIQYGKQATPYIFLHIIDRNQHTDFGMIWFFKHLFSQIYD